MFSAVDPTGVIWASGAIGLVVLIVLAVIWVMGRFKDEA